MATDAFGLSDTPPEVALGLVDEEGNEVQPQAEAEEQKQETTVEAPAQAAEEAPSEEAPEEAPEVEAETQEEAPEAQAVEEQEQEEVPAEDEPRLWANKYQTPDDLEKGYNESREMWRRAVEARKAEEEARYQAELREAELARVITDALPYLREAAAREQQFHQFAEMYKEQVGEYPQGYSGPPVTPENRPMAPQDVNQIIEQRLAAERQQMQEQMLRQREYEVTSEAVMSFYSDHPEVEPRSAADNEITDTMQVLNEAWAGRTGETVDMSDRGTLEVLYEASKRPALREVLALRPEYFDSETGLNLARRDASLLEGAPTDTQETRVVPASKVGETAGQRKPFAEAAVTGAEAEEQEDENDPWVQIKRERAKSQNPASVFQFE